MSVFRTKEASGCSLTNYSSNFIWDLSLSKLYTNALLSTLNARKGLNNTSICPTTFTNDNVLFGSVGSEHMTAWQLTRQTKSDPSNSCHTIPQVHNSQVCQLFLQTIMLIKLTRQSWRHHHLQFSKYSMKIYVMPLRYLFPMRSRG